jgi:hypothetical protein
MDGPLSLRLILCSQKVDRQDQHEALSGEILRKKGAENKLESLFLEMLVVLRMSGYSLSATPHCPRTLHAAFALQQARENDSEKLDDAWMRRMSRKNLW